MNNMHFSKIIVMIIALAGMLNCFTPWADILFFGRAGTVSGFYFIEGLFCLVYFLLIAALCWLSDYSTRWSKKMLAGISISAVVPAALIASRITTLNSQADKLQAYHVDLNQYIIYHPVMGLYIAFTLVIVIVAVVLVTSLKQQKEIHVSSGWPLGQAAGRFFPDVSN